MGELAQVYDDDPAPPRVQVVRTGRTQLAVGELDAVRVQVLAPPVASLTSVLVDAAGGPRQGVPRAWTTALRRALPAQAMAAVAPQLERGLLPDCLTPMTAAPFENQLEQIADLAPYELLESIEEILPDGPPATWRTALRNPSRWLGNYAAVLAAAWRAYRPLWAATGPLRERETERVGRAVVTGTLDLVLGTLTPRTAYTDGVLHLPDSLPYRADLSGRPLLLVPLVAGARASVFNLDDPERAWIGYPVPGLQRDALAPVPAPAEVLPLILGTVRAVLVRSLATPLTMGDLARLTGLSPSQATYHCGQLAAAGLVVRTRTGQSVQVHRTARAEALLDLLT